MSRARSAGDELRLALRSVRAALTSIEHAQESQRIETVNRYRAETIAIELRGLELDVEQLAARCDASDAEWRRTRSRDPKRGRL